MTQLYAALRDQHDRECGLPNYARAYVASDGGVKFPRVTDGHFEARQIAIFDVSTGGLELAFDECNNAIGAGITITGQVSADLMRRAREALAKRGETDAQFKARCVAKLRIIDQATPSHNGDWTARPVGTVRVPNSDRVVASSKTITVDDAIGDSSNSIGIGGVDAVPAPVVPCSFCHGEGLTPRCACCAKTRAPHGTITINGVRSPITDLIYSNASPPPPAVHADAKLFAKSKTWEIHMVTVLRETPRDAAVRAVNEAVAKCPDGLDRDAYRCAILAGIESADPLVSYDFAAKLIQNRNGLANHPMSAAVRAAYDRAIAARGTKHKGRPPASTMHGSKGSREW